MYGEVGSVFQLDGDFWTIAYEGYTIRLRDTRGLRYLSLLLRHPGRRLHASDLVRGLVSGGDGRRAARDPDVQFASDLGDAGLLLDARARSEFSARLTELREELADAEEMNDLGRSERLRAEIDALASQLAAAARDRKSASQTERARLTVTKGLKSAIERISASHPELGRHLGATVRRGIFCVYEPDPRRPIDWTE